MKGKAFGRKETEAFREESICVIEQWGTAPPFYCVRDSPYLILSMDIRYGAILNFQLKNPKPREIRFFGREHTARPWQACQVPHLPVQLLLIDVGGLAVCWSVCLVGTGLDRPTGTRGL